MNSNPVLLFLENLQETSQLRTDDGILLAVSGGADSVALARWMSATGQKMAIAHVNFGLRGAESDEDEAFVKALSEELNVPYFSAKLSATDFARAKKVSIQMAARQLRYDFFEKLRAENQFRLIATAHHLDDSKETAMLHFFRGTGVRGLRGILPQNKDLIRPLLKVTKAEILEEFRINSKFQTQNPPFRADSSNKKNDYLRNYLRHELVPKFEKMNSGFWSKVMPRQLERMRDLDVLVEKLTNNLRQKVMQSVDNQAVISIPMILESDAPRFFLGEILLPFGFNQPQIFDLFDNLSGQSGRQFYSATHRLIQNRSELLINALSEKVEIEKEPHIFDSDTIMEISIGQLSIRKGEKSETPHKNIAIFRQKALVFPLKIRKWQPGDWFCPAGMGGHRKKLSNFFTDLKMSILEKETVRILENAEGDILWVIGFRADARAIASENEIGIVFEFSPI